jgi:hypothetical protein
MISQKLCPAFFLEYLAKTKGQIISISSTYILFLTEMQKRQTLEKGSALFKNDITGSEPTVKILDT